MILFIFLIFFFLGFSIFIGYFSYKFLVGNLCDYLSKINEIQNLNSNNISSNNNDIVNLQIDDLKQTYFSSLISSQESIRVEIFKSLSTNVGLTAGAITTLSSITSKLPVLFSNSQLSFELSESRTNLAFNETLSILRGDLDVNRVNIDRIFNNLLNTQDHFINLYNLIFKILEMILNSNKNYVLDFEILFLLKDFLTTDNLKILLSLVNFISLKEVDIPALELILNRISDVNYYLDPLENNSGIFELTLENIKEKNNN